ncbi:MAG: hypothetical protein AABY83_08645 [Pseudomonadota bacterium]
MTLIFLKGKLAVVQHAYPIKTKKFTRTEGPLSYLVDVTPEFRERLNAAYPAAYLQHIR